MARVLMVDDSQVQKLVIARHLKQLGHDVLDAKDGNEAYALAVEYKPDLILMDIVMPECNGFQAVRKLQSNPDTAKIPVIMVSTKSALVDKVWAKRQGAVGYITKPIDYKEFAKEIENALSSRIGTL